ncbi:hypothetical protein WP1_218 [Pseudomonas phage WP1]
MTDSAANSWANWERDVFQLKTANPFGLMAWCIILGTPSKGFGLYPKNSSGHSVGYARTSSIAVHKFRHRQTHRLAATSTVAAMPKFSTWTKSGKCFS